MDSDRIAAGTLGSHQQRRRHGVVSRVLLAVGLAALVGVGSASAATKNGLFTSHRVSAKVTLPAHAKPGTALVGKFDPGAVKAAKLAVPLPDGQVLDVAQSHVSRDDQTGTVTWTGSVGGSPGGRVVLARHKGTVAGFVQVGARTYEVHATPAGEALLFEVVSPPLAPGDAIPVPSDTAAARAKLSNNLVGRLSADLSPVFQDLLVLYTQSAMVQRGRDWLESMALAAVAGANASYRESGVNLTMSLVGLQSVGITEGSTSQEALNALRTNADVAALRNQLGADLVLLVTGPTDGWCGMAYLMGNNDVQFAPFAFGVVRDACLAGRTLTHELGHIQGLAHDRETGGTGAYPYARGYRRCTTDGSAFYDIMAYSCGASVQLSTFSSPSIFHQGYPTGIAYEFDPANAADGARALNETAATVANFRASVATPPVAPGTLSATALAGRQVRLSWSYSGSTATGFKIERTTDGVRYVEIANVGATSRSHDDLTAASGTTQSYRVAAYNSAGLSGYSGVVTVTTPEVPRAPSALVAAGVPIGQIKLEWVDNASIESGFRIERSTNGAYYYEIASVGANTQSHMDRTISPSTTYWYRVAADSSAGRSDYSNVAAITTPELAQAPSALAATVVSSGQVDLAWVDNASNETGFRIERSTNGANFTAVASIGPESTAHVDRTVASDTTYHYRVAAYNVSGMSGYSNQVTVRTPVAPPQLPSEFSVTNNRKKTARIHFTPSPGAPAANYELMRETFQKKQWRYPTVVFSMQVQAQYAYVDSSGKGTFRYSIRACNAAGCTAYSSPVTVKVTK